MASKGTRDFVPLAMWFVLFAGVLALAFVRSGRPASVWSENFFNGDTVLIGLYLLWMVIELGVTRKDINTEDKTISDFATCQVYGAGQFLTVLSALWYPSVWHTPNPAHIAGLALFIFGAGYRLWAVRTLGRFYSHRVQIVPQHRIVAEGPYRLTRHPAYAGMIVANAGICVFFLNRVTVGVFLFLLIPAILLRIIVEEKTLFRMDGYADFAGNRKRLFPGIW